MIAQYLHNADMACPDLKICRAAHCSVCAWMKRVYVRLGACVFVCVSGGERGGIKGRTSNKVLQILHNNAIHGLGAPGLSLHVEHVPSLERNGLRPWLGM